MTLPSPDLTSTVAKHYNELQEAGLETRVQSRIFYMRNFNNWTKSILIGDILQHLKQDFEYSHITVLDLCAGKGGDLLKWKKGRISQIICADIAATSVEQCESRYNEMMDRGSRERRPQEVFKAEFITADCTKIRLKEKYKDPAQGFHLCSCQFSFHYCFESYEQTMMMLRNASECLRPGGYFIGTTPDSNELIRRLRDSPTNSFGNEVYRVTFPESTKDNFPLFGARYDFHLEGVVDCPEFLVYFPLFEKLAEQFGMKLVRKQNFAEFFSKNQDVGDGRGLLGRMQALEPYPPDEDVELSSKQPDAYSTAKEAWECQQSEPEDNSYRKKTHKIGTMSKDEWEAASKYCQAKIASQT